LVVEEVTVSNSRRALVILVAVTFVFAGQAIAGATQRSKTGAFAIVNGTKTSIAPGQVVAQGVILGGGQGILPETVLCSLPTEVQIGTNLPEGAISGDIVTSFNATCQLVVESVSIDASSAGPESLGVGRADPTSRHGPVSASPATVEPPPDGELNTDPPELENLGQGRVEEGTSAVAHRGWAKAIVQEQFGVTSTEVYVDMRYTRNGGRVYNGRNPLYRDYTSDWPCWHVNPRSYSWWPDGPSNVYIHRRTHFDNCSAPHPDYTTGAKFVANPGPDHICGITGNLPTFWDFRCRGGTYW
jgi:hypothetical protein